MQKKSILLNSAFILVFTLLLTTFAFAYLNSSQQNNFFIDDAREIFSKKIDNSQNNQINEREFIDSNELIKESITDDFRKTETLAEVNEKEGVLKSISTNEKLNYVQGEILVKYKKSKIDLETSSGSRDAQTFSIDNAMMNVEEIRKDNIVLLKISDNKTVEEKIAELENDPNIEYVQPNFQYYPMEINTNDTYKDFLWGLDNTGQIVNGVTGTSGADINAKGAWEISEGTFDVIVAVIDNGVAYNHPDLLVNMWDGESCKDENGGALGNCNYGYDFQDNDKTPLPVVDSHGTHIAGTIAAVKNNSTGIIGVAPNAKIMALKTNYTTSQIVKSINFANQNGARVINASWGDVYEGEYSHYYLDALLYNAIRDFNGLFVAAAGNDTRDHDSGDSGDIMYPAGFRAASSLGDGLDNIIVVAATNQNDVLSSFSDYGELSVDVAAPGENIYSTVNSYLDDSLNEDFESAVVLQTPDGWSVAGDNENWGIYDFEDAYWGKVLYVDLNYPYANNANSTITSPTLDLSSVGGATINFWVQCDTEYDLVEWIDYLALEISSDGSDFNELLKMDEFSLDYLNSDNNSLGAAIHHFENLDLSTQYLTSNFKLRYRWVTDESDNYYDGCFVDDVVIKTYSDGSDNTYAYSAGTSMASPHVAGLAALVWGYDSDLNYSQVKDLILDNGDSLESLNGKTITGKRINAQKTLAALENTTPLANVSVYTNDADLFYGLNQVVRIKINNSPAVEIASVDVNFFDINADNIWVSTTKIDNTTFDLNLGENWVHDFDEILLNLKVTDSLEDFVTIQMDNSVILYNTQIPSGLGGVSTNFQNITDFENVSSLIFEKENAGKLIFNNDFNLIDLSLIENLLLIGDELDINLDIETENYYVDLNTTLITVLNDLNAVVTIYNLPFLTAPKISHTIDETTVEYSLADSNSNGNYIYVDGNLTFDAQGFSRYNIDGTLPTFDLNLNNSSRTLINDINASIDINSSESVVCRYNINEDKTYETMNQTINVNTTGLINIFDLNGAADYNLFVRCKDIAGNDSDGYELFSFTTKIDTTSPVIVLGTPTKTTTSAEMSIATNELVTCRRSVLDLNYDLMPTDVNLVITTIDGNGIGSISLSGLSSNTAYTFYVTCRDFNNNDSSASKVFTTDSVGCTSNCGGGGTTRGGGTGGSGGGGRVVVPKDGTISVFESKQTVTYSSEILRGILNEMTNNQGERLFSTEQIVRMVENSKDYEFEIDSNVEQIVSNGKTSYKTTITIIIKNTTGNDQENVKVVLEIPKEIALNSSQIISDLSFSTLKDDPIVEFIIPSIKSNQSMEIIYAVDSNNKPDLNIIEFASPVISDSTEKSKIDSNLPLACTKEYLPVCGVDGITYSNACNARVAKVKIDYIGKCVIKEEPTIFDNFGKSVNGLPVIYLVLAVLLVLLVGIEIFLMNRRKKK